MLKQADQRQKQLKNRRAVALEALRDNGLIHWFREADDDATRDVKAALFDMLLYEDEEDAAADAAQRYRSLERQRLMHLAAAIALPEDSDGAWTAAQLCESYL